MLPPPCLTRLETHHVFYYKRGTVTEEEVRRKYCNCGGKLDYSAIDGKVCLVCCVCERQYALGGEPINQCQDITLDDIDYRILKHIAFVAYASPLELALCGKSYATIIRRVRRLAKAGYLYINKKHNHRLFLYRTERLEQLAVENGWGASKKVSE